MQNISLDHVRGDGKEQEKIVVDFSSEFWQDEDNIENFCDALKERTAPLILKLKRKSAEDYYKLTGRILWNLQNCKNVHTLILSNIFVKLTILTSISESDRYPKYKNKYSLNFLELLLVNLFYEHKNLRRFRISHFNMFSLFILLVVLSEVNERTNKIIGQITLLDIKAIAVGLNTHHHYSKRKNCNLIEFSVLNLDDHFKFTDVVVLAMNDLIFEIVSNNRKLRILNLPKEHVNEKILKHIGSNYTLLDCNFQPENIRQRNNQIYQWTKEGVLTIIMIKKYRKSILNMLNKDLLSLITKQIWDFRHDLEHLKQLANEL